MVGIANCRYPSPPATPRILGPAVRSGTARGWADLANEWFEVLEAPSKEMIIFEHSGHRPLFEKPPVFASVMARILDATSQKPLYGRHRH